MAAGTHCKVGCSDSADGRINGKWLQLLHICWPHSLVRAAHAQVVRFSLPTSHHLSVGTNSFLRHLVSLVVVQKFSISQNSPLLHPSRSHLSFPPHYLQTLNAVQQPPPQTVAAGRSSLAALPTPSSAGRRRQRRRQTL